MMDTSWAWILETPMGMPVGGACMTEADETGHVLDSMKSSPPSHGHPALKGEGKRWKGNG